MDLRKVVRIDRPATTVRWQGGGLRRSVAPLGATGSWC